MGWALSALVEAALVIRAQLRDEFEDLRAAAYNFAVDETNGHLLSRAAKARGVDDYALFIGSRSWAYANASEELREHWERHGRLSFADYERQQVWRFFATS